MRTYIGLMTGHCMLRSYMYRIGRSELSIRRLCLQEDESARHILCECVAVGRLRLRHFDEGFLEPNTICKVEPKRIVQFFEDLEDLND